MSPAWRDGKQLWHPLECGRSGQTPNYSSTMMRNSRAGGARVTVEGWRTRMSAPLKGGSCERCRSFDFGGVGEAGAEDHGGSRGIAAGAGAAEECAVYAAAAGVV